MSTKRIQHMFVVRFWAESTTVPSAAEWHGLVQHVATGQKLYFKALEDLTCFIETQRAGDDQPDNLDKEAKTAPLE